MASPAISIKNLSKTYRSKNNVVKALDDVSLDIPRGSFFGLLGPNGAGKSTLINILASLVKKDTGAITICDINFEQHLNKAKAKLGVVPQELILDPFFTVREALDFYAGYFGVPKAKRRTDELISALGLDDKCEVGPRSLSGGMKRRLLVAKALVHDPEIIILDEPTAGVDVELRDQLWKYIKKLNKAGKTIILTTHYLEEAEELCDQIAIINHGKIITNEKKTKLKEIFGLQRLHIELSKSNKALVKNLSKYGEVTEKKNSLILTYKKGDFNYADLLELLAKSKNSITNLTTQETDIEDIFKNLVYNK